MKIYNSLNTLMIMVILILLGVMFFSCDDSKRIEPPKWPEARNLHAAAYVPSTNEMLVFGGTTGSGENNQLWSYRNGTWTFLAKDGPLSREDALLIHNSDDQMTYLIGGRHNSTGVVYTDFWKWDGTKWIQISSSLPFAPLTHFAGCYDSKNKRLLVFGGVKNNQLSNEVWSWDGNTWSSIATGPSGRLASALVYSTQHQKVYSFGGTLQNGTILKDIWVLDNTTWTKINENFPGVMISAYGVCETNSSFLVFGGFLSNGQQSSETWSFSVSTNTWTNVSATGPSKRALHSLVYDAQADHVLMYGGGSSGVMLDELWKFKQNTWTQIEKP